MSDCGVPVSRLLGDITRYLGVAQTSSLTHAQRHQPVTGISQDSRSVRPGDLYIALPGRTHHGGRPRCEAAAREVSLLRAAMSVRRLGRARQRGEIGDDDGIVGSWLVEIW